MPSKPLMNLRILLPFRVFSAEAGVSRIVTDTIAGSVGILPRRLDFVAAISPGILVYEIGDEGEVYVAVDQGIVIKTGFDVLVSVRNAIGGSSLSQLTETVEREFKVLNESEQNIRLAMSKMESSFIRRIAGFSHE